MADKYTKSVLPLILSLTAGYVDTAVWRQPLLALDAVLSVSTGLDQAGIDQSFLRQSDPRRAPAQNGFEEPSQQIAIAEATMPVLREVEWSGTSPSSPRRQNQRYARLR